MNSYISGFQMFKTRIIEVLNATSGANLDDFIDDAGLRSFYRDGYSAEYVASFWSSDDD